MVQEGMVKPAEPDFKKRFLEAKTNFERFCRQRDQVAVELAPAYKVDHTKISNFVDQLSRVLEGDVIPLEKGYLRALVDQIIVGEDCITISGRRSNFERSIKKGCAALAKVPTFVREWRRDRDSNPG